MSRVVVEQGQPSEEGRAAVLAALRKGERHVGPYWAVFRDGVLVRFETAGGHLVHTVGDAPRDIDAIAKPEGHEEPLAVLLGIAPPA